MAKPYDHKHIEAKGRQKHLKLKLSEIDAAKAADPYYVLDMFPYPSGHGLHVGHWRGYVMSDFYARHAVLNGKTVLHPMGFDSFGLPAENAAIKYKSHPRKFTDEAIATIREQLDQMGAMFDWTKYLSTSDPNYYRWTQWLFLQFFKHGLAEKRSSLVNWCPLDQTVLANEQVINGCCERCGSAVTKKELSQWFIKTTAFAQDLLDGLESVAWPERVKALQRDWIGRSDGATINFDSPAGAIDVFTTRVDTIYGVTALVLSPEHPLVEKLTVSDNLAEITAYQQRVRAKTDVDRQQDWEKEKTAVFTGSFATHPLTSQRVPIWIADYVLMSYGTGAVMSVPAHDDRDYQFATKYGLPVIQVVAEQLTQTTEPGTYRPNEPTATQDGVIVFVKHWSEEKYLALAWKEVAWGTLLTGSVEKGVSPEATVIKEVMEETGYKSIEVTKLLGVVDGLFYHVPKKTNKLVHGYVYLCELRNDARDALSSEEAAKHDIKWLTKKELAQFLTPDTHQKALDYLQVGYLPHDQTGSLVNSAEFTGMPNEAAAKKITTTLEKLGKGRATSNFRLRDWLVSRQRYWGAPIPIVYDPDGQPHAVKDEHLPLLLPEDVDFLPGGQSPIARSREYQQRAEQLYGKGWHFETDTLDTFVDSSWYFFRYLSPTDSNQAFNPQLVKKWLPVDLYIGGIEHATLHLLYARVVARFLATYGYIDKTVAEPFANLFSIGTITMHGAKMSKSKGNVVSQELLLEHYGTDALRGYELFIGPLDVEADWNSRGINGVHRFLIKLYNLSVTDSANNDQQPKANFSAYLLRINQMITDFRLNTVVAEAMKFINVNGSSLTLEVWKKFLITLAPIFPYLTEELWERTGEKGSIFQQTWPVTNKLAQPAKLKVLVNQKFVSTLSPQSVDEQAVTDEAKALPAVSKLLAGKTINRVVYKPGEMINLIGR